MKQMIKCLQLPWNVAARTEALDQKQEMKVKEERNLFIRFMWFFNCKKFPLSQGFDLLSMCVFESFRECFLGLNFVKFVLGYVGIYNKCYLNYAIQSITFVVHTWTESIYSTLTLGTRASDSTLVLINLHALNQDLLPPLPPWTIWDTPDDCPRSEISQNQCLPPSTNHFSFIPKVDTKPGVTHQLMSTSVHTFPFSNQS